MVDRIVHGKSPPGEVQSEIEEGKKYIEDGNYLEAHSVFIKLSAICHKFSKEEQVCIYCGLGEALWELGEYISAKENYLSALKKDPHNAKALSGLGGVLGDLNEMGPCLYYYDQALTCGACGATVKVETLNNKAYEYIKFGRLDEAQEYLNEALRINSENVPSLINTGYISYRKHLYEKAVTEFDNAIDIINKFYGWSEKPIWKNYCATILKYKGVALAATEKYSDSVKCFDEAIELCPDDIDLYLHKGSVLTNDNRYGEAQTCFDQALSLNPRNAGALIGQNALKQIEAKDRDIKVQIKDFRMSLLSSQQNVQELSQKYLGKVLRDFTFGLNSAQWMFIIQFGVGVGILSGAVWLNVTGYSDLLAYILGAVGGLTIITSAIFTSPLRIQDNRVDFAQWMMSYFDWVYTLYTAQMVLAQKADEGKAPEWVDVKPIHEDLHAITREAVNMIETYCTVEQHKNARICPEKKILPRKVCSPVERITINDDGSAGGSNIGNIDAKGKVEKDLDHQEVPIYPK